jgi:hypothetical protein
MKLFSQLIVSLSILAIIMTCMRSTSNRTIIEGKLLTQKCVSDTNHSYTLYIPSHENACVSMPLIVVVDPHGSGKSVINKFFDPAEKYKCIIAASNLIKNNYPEYNRSIQQLILDVKKKYPVNNFVYICGFSGGARMAISFSQSNNVDGILACGALATINELKASRSHIYSIMGMTDFNFPEIAEFIITPELKPHNLSLEIYGELHEWPDSSVLSRGIGFLINISEQNDNLSHLKKYISIYLENNFLTQAYNYEKSQEFIKARLIYSNLLELDNLEHKKTVQKCLDSISNSISYMAEIQQFKKSLQFEMKLREAYYNAFTTSDANWWTKEVATLNYQIENETNKYDLFVYKRIKAYLGIICYSLSRNFLSNNDMTNAFKALAIYKLIEPQNPDMFYFSALYNLKKGNTNQAEELIRKAMKSGYNDTMLIRQNFPQRIVDRVF